MSRTTDYEAKTEALLKPIAEKMGLEIYDIEYVKEGSDYILRAYIDKEGGISINDCEAASRALSDILDENDFIADAYILEVSSPGLGRQLKKDKHLTKSIGEEVEIKTYKPVRTKTETDDTPSQNKKKRKQAESAKEFTGILKNFDNEKITIENDEGETSFARLDIAMIRLKFDF
jgi:ribosome maturation factor RimP